MSLAAYASETKKRFNSFLYYEKLSCVTSVTFYKPRESSLVVYFRTLRKLFEAVCFVIFL